MISRRAHLVATATLHAFMHRRFKKHAGVASLDGFFAGATVEALGVTFAVDADKNPV